MMRLAGRVDTPYLESKVLQGNLPGDPTERMLPVYLPPGYDDDPKRRYPVIWVLAGHGGSGPLMLTPTAWGESFPERIDRLIRTGSMPPVIAVLPDCFTIFGGAQYINSTALGRYEDYLIDELIPYVDSTYRTLPDRQHRGITGKSSGGYGAMVQAMRHPELYGAFASHSGDIYFEFGYLPDMAKLHANLMRFGGLEGFIAAIPTYKPKDHMPFFSVLGMLCYGAAFAPNPDAPRGFDMPVDDETGALREDVWARWLAWDPVRMVPRYADALRGLVAVWIDAGKADEWYLDLGAEAMVAELEKIGVTDVHFELFDGTHMSIDYRYPLSLAYLARKLSPRSR